MGTDKGALEGVWEKRAWSLEEGQKEVRRKLEDGWSLGQARGMISEIGLKTEGLETRAAIILENMDQWFAGSGTVGGNQDCNGEMSEMNMHHTHVEWLRFNGLWAKQRRYTRS